MECKLKENNKSECKLMNNKCSIKENSKTSNSINECSIEKKDNDKKNGEVYSIKLYRNLFNYQNGVHELIYKDFTLKKNKIFLNNNFFDKGKGFILFYAPWCSHCKKFKKEYEDLAIDYIQLFPFGAINVENVKDENDKLRAYAKIESIPKLKYINSGGYLENFESDYSYDDLLYFINMNL